MRIEKTFNCCRLLILKLNKTFRITLKSKPLDWKFYLQFFYPIHICAGSYYYERKQEFK